MDGFDGRTGAVFNARPRGSERMSKVFYLMVRRRFFSFLPWVALALYLSPSEAVQDWLYRPYLTPEGLPIENARAVAEDTHGTIWVATWGTGVHALRGTDWRVYNETRGLGGDWTLCLETDDRGGVWVGTADGLSHIVDATVETFTKENVPVLKSDYVLCLEWISTGELWIGGDSNEIVSYRPDTKEWKLIAGEEVTGGSHVEAILETREGPIWLLLENKVALRYDGRNWDRYEEDRGFDIAGRRLHQTLSGDVWAFGLESPLRFSKGEWEQDARLGGILATSIADVTADEAFVGSAAGLHRLSQRRCSQVPLSDELGAPYVNAVFLSSKGALWVATHDGLIRGSRTPWRRVTEKETGHSLNTNAFYSDPNLHLWAMGEENCLLRYDGMGWDKQICFPGIEGPFHELTQPVEGNMWTLAGNVAVEFSLEDQEVLRMVPFDEEVSHLEIAHLSDGEVWLLTSDGFFELDDEDQWEPLSTNIPEDQAEDLILSQDGARYYCYESRILRSRDGVFEDLARENSLLGNGAHFKSLCISREGNLWIGTYGRGVLRYDGENLEQFTVESGLMSNYVTHLYEAMDGTIWAAFRRKGCGSYRDGRWLNYSTEHGLPHESSERFAEYPIGSIWLASGGEFYRLEDDEDPPETYLVGAPDHLAHKRVGVFTFSGMDSWERTPRDRLEFSWRIESPNGRSPVPHWTPFGKSTSAITPALSHGRYIFQVRAADEDRNTDPTPIVFEFIVEPPLWLTNGFLLSVGFLLSAALIGGALAFAKHSAANRSQAALREAEEKAAVFGRVLDGAHSEIYIFDEKTHKFLQVNRGAIENLGYSAEEFLEMTPLDLNPSRTHEELVKMLGPIVDGRMEVVHFNSRHRRKDGTVYPTEIYIQRVSFKSSPALLAVVLDATEKLKAESERKALEEKIQHTQKLESLGVLAGGIAHDFNNLLMGILGYAGLAQLELPNSSEAHNYLKEIEVSGRRAADLCKQMLAYSGKGKFIVKPLDLSELVEEMSNLLNVSISKAAVLKSNFAKALPAIEADPTQIRQVVMNLITNASEALEEKNGVISISTGWMECDSEYLRDTYLDVDLPPGPYVYVEVADTGCGMDEDTKGKLFDPFFTTKFTGRGLGLAAVLGIVRGHGGTIKVYSEKGKGSVFKVFFPASETPVAKSGATDASVLPLNGQGTILVVDDEETVRRLSRRILERAGYKVFTASDGTEGLELYRQYADTIDLVLLDMTMPRLGGEAAFRELRRIRSDVRVLLSSGYNEQEATSGFAGKGLSGFIQKPYTPDELYAAISRVLKESDERV
jgi:PAS domain S-box-containing protein